MTERPIDLSTLPSYQAPKRSVFSLRKFALMASVVAGLGAPVYGFSPSHGPARHLHVDARMRRSTTRFARSRSRSALPTSSSG